VVRALRTFDADAVVHLAADSLVGESMTHPAKYYANNVVAGLTLLGAMKAAAVDRMVFSSTAAVYGEPKRQPVEETAPTQPTNPYGETKLAFEHALRWHYEAYGIASLSLRYFNAAGATERNGERHSPETHLIPIVLQAVAGQSGPSRYSATITRRAMAHAYATTSTCRISPARTSQRWSHSSMRRHAARTTWDAAAWAIPFAKSSTPSSA
jgi:nucleoside-diphosphate-sugar epimerase